MISLNYRRKWKHGKPKTRLKRNQHLVQPPCPATILLLPCRPACSVNVSVPPQQTVQSRRPLHYEGPPPSYTTFGSFFIFFFFFFWNLLLSSSSSFFERSQKSKVKNPKKPESNGVNHYMLRVQ